MHVSHMRSFVPEQAMQQGAKASASPPQAYSTQRVQAIPAGDGRDPRGSRQQTTQQNGAKLTVFENNAAAVRSFSSQLAALDLASLGGAASASEQSGEPTQTMVGTEDAGLFQLLAKAASQS